MITFFWFEILLFFVTKCKNILHLWRYTSYRKHCFYSLFIKPSNSIPSSYEVHKFNFQLFNLVTAMVSIYLIFKILTFFALFLWLNAEIFCFYSNLPQTDNRHIFFKFFFSINPIYYIPSSYELHKWNFQLFKCHHVS